MIRLGQVEKRGKVALLRRIVNIVRKGSVKFDFSEEVGDEDSSLVHGCCLGYRQDGGKAFVSQRAKR